MIIFIYEWEELLNFEVWRRWPSARYICKSCCSMLRRNLMAYVQANILVCTSIHAVRASPVVSRHTQRALRRKTSDHGQDHASWSSQRLCYLITTRSCWAWRKRVEWQRLENSNFARVSSLRLCPRMPVAETPPRPPPPQSKRQQPWPRTRTRPRFA